LRVMKKSPPVYEASVEEIRSLYKSNELTCKSVVKQYISRIEEFDNHGPGLQSIITVNADAMERAEELDREFSDSGELTGPLHGIPVVVKDQVETKDITTTFGSIAMSDYMPEEDAELIEKLKDAGAIILAKTNLSDWACNWYCFSSALGGRTKNPYDLKRDAGGSSGGTGVAVAANLGTVGIGEDTGGSIRCPSSFNNLFGLRPTPGLISRDGMQPLIKPLDTAGPMTRTVRDAAILLDVLVGYDPDDEYTSLNELSDFDGSYVDTLEAGALSDARIGVLRSGFGDDPAAVPVNEKVNEVIAQMDETGTELVDPVSIPDLNEYIEATSLYHLESKEAINDFLAERDVPVDTVEEIYETGQYHELHDLFETVAEAPDDPATVPEYWEKIGTIEMFQREILNVFTKHDLDAMLYPNIRHLPPIDEEVVEDDLYPDTMRDFPSNTMIVSQSKLCGVSIPAGLTEDGVPVGVELAGKPLAEPTLLKLAYSYEQMTDNREPPETAPEI